jgi:NADPH:quinone reductase-like Zn-dependent oxidoreductase
VILAPDGVPDDHLGALWLAYLTAWGCLAWKQELQAGQMVLMTAASSPVAWAAAQVARSRGAVTIGVSTSPTKVDLIRARRDHPYDHLVSSRDAEGQSRAWTNEVRRIAGAGGVHCVFDPVAAGGHMDQLMKVLGQRGTIWIYGLLGEIGPVNLFPLIRKWASIRGWLLGELVETGPVQVAMEETLARVASGEWRLPIAGTYPLDRVREAHEVMAKAAHLGKLILVP